MNDITEKFFKTFGIEPRYNYESCERCVYFDNDYCSCDKVKKYTECDKAEPLYPLITDRILLELICIYNSECFWEDDVYIVPRDINKLKEYTLIHLINYKEYTFKHQWENIIKQVQALFKGGE